MKAAIIGATGLVGRHVLGLLLAKQRYSEVHYVGRRRIDSNNSKLIQHIINLSDIDQLELETQIDDAFCTLGTTIKQAGTEDRFREVDHDYVLAFANWARKHGASSMAVNSSVGAKAGSRNFYLATKGDMEASLKALGFDRLVIVRPSLLIPTGRSEARVGEIVGFWFLRLIGWLLIGPLKRYRPVSPAAVAVLLVNSVLNKEKGISIYESEKIS